MKIQKLTKYLYKGKEYTDLKAIKEEIHNTIGLEVLDKINRVCPPEQHKNIFKMLEVLCTPEVRKTLLECYSVYVDIVDETYEDEVETINILDL